MPIYMYILEPSRFCMRWVRIAFISVTIHAKKDFLREMNLLFEFEKSCLDIVVTKLEEHFIGRTG